MSVSSSTTTAAIAAAPLSAGELLLDVLPVAFAAGYALDLAHTLQLCGTTWRRGAARADGSLDRAGFLGGTADRIDCSLRLQAPWLEAARRAPREDAVMKGCVVESTSSLTRAAYAGDERCVRKLLAAGAPLLCVDGEGKTALHWACDQGSARIISGTSAFWP